MDNSTHKTEYRYSRRSFIKTGMILGLGYGLSHVKAFGTVEPDNTSDIWNVLAKHIAIRPRHTWAHQAPDTSLLTPSSPYYCITIHHEGSQPCTDMASDTVMTNLQTILDGHTKRQYGDIAYHMIIDYAGRLWEGRSLSYQGAHVCRKNAGNIGIMLLGNFEKQTPSEAQINTLATTTNLVCQHFDIRPSQIYGHRDLAQTLCPGAYLYSQLTDIKKTASAV